MFNETYKRGDSSDKVRDSSEAKKSPKKNETTGDSYLAENIQNDARLVESTYREKRKHSLSSPSLFVDPCVRFASTTTISSGCAFPSPTPSLEEVALLLEEDRRSRKSRVMDLVKQWEENITIGNENNNKPSPERNLKGERSNSLQRRPKILTERQEEVQVAGEAALKRETKSQEGEQPQQQEEPKSQPQRENIQSGDERIKAESLQGTQQQQQQQKAEAVTKELRFEGDEKSASETRSSPRHVEVAASSSSSCEIRGSQKQIATVVENKREGEAEADERKANRRSSSNLAGEWKEGIVERRGTVRGDRESYLRSQEEDELIFSEDNEAVLVTLRKPSVATDESGGEREEELKSLEREIARKTKEMERIQEELQALKRRREALLSKKG